MIKYDFKSTNYFENNYLDFDKCNTKLNEYDIDYEKYDSKHLCWYETYELLLITL